MNRHVAWILTLVAGAWGVQSAPAQVANPPATPKAVAPAAPLTPAQKAEADKRAALAMNPILAEWEIRSTKIVSLDAAFDMVEKDPTFGNTYFRGRAMLQSPDKACLQFQLYKLDADKKPIILVNDKGKKVAQLEKEPERRLVCTGTEVLQYTWANKTITVYPLGKQAQQRALQEGPLPFLFNMKAEAAKQRYGMWLSKEFQQEYVIDIVPLQQIDRDSFEKARLWLNKETFLPNQLWLVKTGNKGMEQYKFNGPNDEVLVNNPMDQKWFGFLNFKDWKTVVNKGDQPKAADVGQGPLVPIDPKQQAAQPGGRSRPR